MISGVQRSNGGQIDTSARISNRAFTLIEIMASIALLSLIVVLLGGMAREVTSAWVVNQGQTETQQNARAIGDIITRDVEGALLPIDTASTASLQFVLNSGINNKYLNSDAIFFQAPVATDGRRGDIAQIGYFVRWVDETDSTGKSLPVARLCRFYVDRFTIDPSGNTPLPIYENPSGWASDSEIDNENYGAPADSQNEYRGMLADNVIGFWARPIDHDGNVIPGSSFDSRNTQTHTLPAQLEISFVMIDSRSAQRIGDLKDMITGATQTASSSAGTDLSKSPADEFLEAAKNNDSFTPIRQGMRGYTTRVSLSNSIDLGTNNQP